ILLVVEDKVDKGVIGSIEGLRPRRVARVAQRLLVLQPPRVRALNRGIAPVRCVQKLAVSLVRSPSIEPYEVALLDPVLSTISRTAAYPAVAHISTSKAE